MLLPPRSARISLLLHLLLFLVVAASALNYWKSANYALHGNWFIEYYKLPSYTSLVPTRLKLAKDGFAFLLLVGSLSFKSTNPDIILRGNKGLGVSYALCLCILGLAIARSLASDLPITAILSTLRPLIIVLAIFVFCHRHLHPYYLRWVFEATNGLALIQFYYALQQRQAAIIYNGVGLFDSGSARSVGTFTEPNTMGLFVALVFYLNLLVLPFHRLRLAMLGACSITIFLTGSRTALLIILLLVTTQLYQQLRQRLAVLRNPTFITFTLLPVFAMVAVWVLAQVNQISGRSASSSASGGRLDILIGYINQTDSLSLLVGQYLSFGSNLVQTLSLGQSDAEGKVFFLADSTWAALLGQFGFLGIFVFISIVYSLWKAPLLQSTELERNQQWLNQIRGGLTQERAGPLLYFILSSFTIILQEFYAVFPLFICLLFPWRIPLASYIFSEPNQYYGEEPYQPLP